MVFAQAGDVDISHDDHFIMVLGEDSVVNNVFGAVKLMEGPD
jgi:hypothetical protein